MRVSSFTNKHGTYYKDTVFVEPEEYTYDGITTYYTEHRPQGTVGYSKKEYPYSPGRHPVVKAFRLPSYYHRRVRNVTDNTPEKISSKSTEGGHTATYSRTRYLLPRIDVGEFSRSWPGRVSNAVNETNVKARLKLKSHRMQVGADLGEAKATFNMFATNAAQMARAIIAAKHGQWGRIPSLLGMSKGDIISGKAVANRWLEYQYGWKPLMGTLTDLGHRLVDDLSHILIFRGKSSVKLTNSESGIDQGYQFETTEEGFVTTCYWAKVAKPALADTEAMGLINPASIAWELMPFSFVLDWFVPVGNVLESLTATLGLDFVAGYRTTVAKSIRSWRSVPGYFNLEEPGHLSAEFFQFDREALNGFQLPALYGNENPFTTGHTLNALALARQALFR